MVVPKTVLIVGAGASVPYGLPTSLGLMKQVCDRPERVHLRPEDSPASEWVDMETDRFAQALRKSGQSSIDAFLERRQEFKDIGLVQIAAKLLPREQEAVQTGIVSQDWIAWLFRRLEEGKSLRSDALSIVTFNYDRLVEFGLAMAHSNSHGSKPDESQQIVGSIKTVHVYGSLEAERSLYAIERSRSLPNPYQIVSASKGIRIIEEHRDSAQGRELGTARELVWGAEQVVFLGFSFNTTNLDRIGIGPTHEEWAKRPRRVFATAYKLGERTRREAPLQLNLEPTWGGDSESCLDFLDRLVTI